jgi:hypothetical protein
LAEWKLFYTNTRPTTTPTTDVATIPRRRRQTTFVALGIAALLAIGTGAGAATLLDHDNGSGAVTHPTTAAVTATSTTDADTLWSYLAQLPTAERDHVLVALTHDPSGALRAITAGMLAAAR